SRVVDRGAGPGQIDGIVLVLRLRRGSLRDEIADRARLRRPLRPRWCLCLVRHEGTARVAVGCRLAYASGGSGRGRRLHVVGVRVTESRCEKAVGGTDGSKREVEAWWLLLWAWPGSGSARTL